jgi:hypothetical protein
MDAMRSFGRVTANLIIAAVYFHGQCERKRSRKWNTYLIRTQLVVISLVRKENAKLHWEHPISAGLNQRKKPELQVNLVLALVVVVNGDDFLSRSTWNTGLGLESEGGVLGIHTIHEIFRILAIKGKALDSVDLLD